jgi:hypothetical protein
MVDASMTLTPLKGGFLLLNYYSHG